jgi:hypothetical protein
MLTTHRYLAPRLRMSGTIPLSPLRAYIRVAKLSQKSRRHLKILGARSKFHNDLQILGANILNLVATATGLSAPLTYMVYRGTASSFCLLSDLDKARRLKAITSSLYDACARVYNRAVVHVFNY